MILGITKPRDEFDPTFQEMFDNPVVAERIRNGDIGDLYPADSYSDYFVPAGNRVILTGPEARAESLIKRLVKSNDFDPFDDNDIAFNGGRFFVRTFAVDEIDGDKGRPPSVAELFLQEVQEDINDASGEVFTLTDIVMLMKGFVVLSGVAIAAGLFFKSGGGSVFNSFVNSKGKGKK